MMAGISTILVSGLLCSSVRALWPIPTISYTNGSDILQLDCSGLTYEYVGPQTDMCSVGPGMYNASCPSKWNACSKVEGALKRTIDDMANEDFMPWMIHPNDQEFEPNESEISSALSISGIKVVQTYWDPSRAPLAGEVDESYNLTVSTDGQITISCASSFACLDGLTSLTQLFYKHSGGAVYTNVAPVHIRDSPIYGHRGLNFDVSRHWYPMADIKRTVTGLAMNKLNRLHLHVTDAQSWPLEIPSMPELADEGAYHRGLKYSAGQIKELLEFGEARGVQIILEIDMPGHTTSVGHSHPDLIAAMNIQPDWQTYANEPPSGQLKLNNPSVNSFVKDLLDDLLPRVSDQTMYFHTGGDEVNQNVYLLDPGVKSNDSKAIQPYINEFVLNAHEVVHSHNMVPVVWQEMALTWNVSLSKDTVVQAWLSASSVKEIVNKGYKTIVGSYDYTYLDCGRGGWVDYSPSSFESSYPFLDYCAPTKNWHLLYSFDPVGNLTDEESKYVIGGEVHIWSEQTDSTNIDQTVWPRAAAAAEVFWSGRKDSHGQNRTLLDAGPRLREQRERMVLKGVNARPIQPLWCLQRPGQCVT